MPAAAITAAAQQSVIAQIISSIALRLPCRSEMKPAISAPANSAQICTAMKMAATSSARFQTSVAKTIRKGLTPAATPTSRRIRTTRRYELSLRKKVTPRRRCSFHVSCCLAALDGGSLTCAKSSQAIAVATTEAAKSTPKLRGKSNGPSSPIIHWTKGVTTKNTSTSAPSLRHMCRLPRRVVGTDFVTMSCSVRPEIASPAR